MSDINTTFIIALIIILLGYFLKRIKLLKERDGVIISKVIFNVTLPAVILKFTSVINIEISLFLLPIVTILFGFLMTIIGLLLFKNYSKGFKGALIISMVGFNVANFIFPLVEGIWGQQGMSFISFVDVGNAFTIFVLCYTLASIFSPKNDTEKVNLNLKYILGRLVRSTPLISYIIALTINISGLTIPSPLIDIINTVAGANGFLALFLLGLFLSFKFEKTEWLNIIKVLILRYSIGLVIGLSLFFLLPSIHFSLLFRLILLLSLVLPIGLAVIPFSVEFDYDQRLITMLVNLSIIISFILIWILILILNF